MKAVPVLKMINVGITIHLNDDEAGGLLFALKDYNRLMTEHGNMRGGKEWKWIDQLTASIELARNAKQEQP